MKFLKLTFLLLSVLVFWSKKLKVLQLFNPQTNDETPVIKFGEQLVLNFDDLGNSNLPFINIHLNILIGIGKMTVCFLQNMPKEMWTLFNSRFSIFFQYQPKVYALYTLIFPNDKSNQKFQEIMNLLFLDSASKPFLKRGFV